MSLPFNQIKKAAHLLLEEGWVYELRALGVPVDWSDKGQTYSGYFSDREKLTAAAVNLDRKGAKAVYVTLNPVQPDLLARRKNRVERSPRSTTKNEEIQRRRLLLLDFDPVRPAGISSTAEELKAARARAVEVGHFLKGEGWPGGVLAESGNGAHLLYRVDLSPDDGGLTKRVLEALDERFTGGGVDVDTGVHNAARISKLYGTTARKGDATDARPHRRAKIIRASDRLQVVPRAKLAAIAETAETKGEAPSTSHSSGAGNGPEAKPSGSADGLSEAEVRRALACIPRPDYDDWFRIVAAVFDAVDRDAGRAETLLKEWSDEDEPGEYARILGSDLNGSITFKTLIHRAQEYGYTPPRKRNGRAKPKPKGHASKNASGGDDDRTQAEVLLDLAAGVELFHTAKGEPYATFTVAGTQRTASVGSSSFANFLRRGFRNQRGKPPSPQALTDAKNSIRADAEFDGEKKEVHLRVAGGSEAGGGCIYVDLCNDAWEAVKITAEGWEVVSDPPVKFRRVQGMKALPKPQEGGSLDLLRRHVRLSGEGFTLLLGYLVQSVRPVGPYPILELTGEQGSGKSTAAKMIRALVDPSHMPIRARPHKQQDLVIAAENAHMPAFDNMSDVPPWISDAMCRLSTGGGFGTRKLYADREEEIFYARRPMILNGINKLAGRSDLADRAIRLELEAIPEGERRTEADVWKRFEADRPRIIGALFDAVATALRREPGVELDRLPRMADFARWAVAAEPAFPSLNTNESGESAFLNAYEENRAEASESAVEADTVASAIRALLSDSERETPGTWEGKTSELRDDLQGYLPDPKDPPKDYPASHQAMTARLKRAMPDLRAVGIDRVDGLGPQGRRFQITARQAPEAPEQRSNPATDATNGGSALRRSDSAPEAHRNTTGGTGKRRSSTGVEKRPSQPTNADYSGTPATPVVNGRESKDTHADRATHDGKPVTVIRERGNVSIVEDAERGRFSVQTDELEYSSAPF